MRGVICPHIYLYTCKKSSNFSNLHFQQWALWDEVRTLILDLHLWQTIVILLKYLVYIGWEVKQTIVSFVLQSWDKRIKSVVVLLKYSEIRLIFIVFNARAIQRNSRHIFRIFIVLLNRWQLFLKKRCNPVFINKSVPSRISLDRTYIPRYKHDYMGDNCSFILQFFLTSFLLML